MRRREATMPQLNPLDWGPQILWLLITFGILYLLMVYVALPRIGSVIEARAARIAGDLAAAEKLRRETEAAIAAYEQALAEAKQKAHAIVEEGRTKLKAQTTEERARLESELAARGSDAEARIAAARDAAMKDVNSVAADVAADIVRRLIGVAADKAEIDKAVETARKA
jgi:F-type H+-transporting ATPase subunit b